MLNKTKQDIKSKQQPHFKKKDNAKYIMSSLNKESSITLLSNLVYTHTLLACLLASPSPLSLWAKQSMSYFFFHFNINTPSSFFFPFFFLLHLTPILFYLIYHSFFLFLSFFLLCYQIKNNRQTKHTNKRTSHRHIFFSLKKLHFTSSKNIKLIDFKRVQV